MQTTTVPNTPASRRGGHCVSKHSWAPSTHDFPTGERSCSLRTCNRKKWPTSSDPPKAPQSCAESLTAVGGSSAVLLGRESPCMRQAMNPICSMWVFWVVLATGLSRLLRHMQVNGHTLTPRPRNARTQTLLQTGPHLPTRTHQPAPCTQTHTSADPRTASSIAPPHHLSPWSCQSL